MGSKKARTKTLPSRLQEKHPLALPPSVRPTTLDEVAAMLAQISGGQKMDFEQEAMLPILLKQHERLSALVRELAANGKPPKVAKVAREALVESTIRDIQSLGCMEPVKLREHAEGRAYFPVLAGEHPQSQVQISQRLRAIHLGRKLTSCHSESRLKLDPFTKVAAEIRDKLIVERPDLASANWPAVTKVIRKKMLKELFAESPGLNEKLGELIKAPSDQDKPGRLNSRVKDTIIARLLSLGGHNKS